MNAEERVLKLEEAIEILSGVIKEENVIDPVYEISSGSAKGDGYNSFITRVIVKGKDKVLPLIIKLAPKQLGVMERSILRASFLQEIHYYDKIFPAFKKFQEKKSVRRPFNATPICYKTVDTVENELLVLENIKEKGFKVFEKKQQMDRAHIELVLKSYGELHALSFAMKEHDFESFNNLKKDMGAPLDNINEEVCNMFVDGIDKIRMSFDENKESNVHNYFAGFKDRVGQFFKNIAHYKGKYGVLAHGDCWCNNMMFKYEGETSTPPIDMRMFDFQIGYLTSPVIDLSYFMYVSASEEMLDNLDGYLKIYHDSLRAHLLTMGSDVENHYPFSALKEEWRLYAKYGLIFASCVYRVMLRDDDEMLELSSDLSFKEVFMNSSKNDHLINEKYRMLGSHFYKNNFI